MMLRNTTRRGFLAGCTSAAATAVWSATTLGRAESSAPYQLGCQTLPYRAYPLQRALEGIQRAGYRYVHPYHTHEGKPVFTPDMAAGQQADLRRMFRDYGLTPHMAFIGLVGGDLTTGKGPTVWKKELDLFREFEIRTCVGVGPWYFQKFPDQPRPADEYTAACEAWYKGLEQVVPHAEQLGITITLKPHTGITATAAACLKVVGRVVSERLKICWDAGNVSYYEGVRPDPDFPALAPHVRAVCIKDHRGPRAHADFPVPGEGDVDHEAMFKTLFGAGFRGPLAVERVDGTMNALQMDADLIDRRIAQARAFLAPLLEKCSARSTA
ncbi:MAG: sugar phosphate isomerase/epimerase [Candidatus Sumerlaeia bacterium]|nr:sugar phosphate isomerase/epimerase [Candidatus Sumerlaeia bacterium]